MKQKSRASTRLFFLKHIGNQFFLMLIVFFPPEPELPELLLFPVLCFGLMVVPPDEEFEPDFLGVVIV